MQLSNLVLPEVAKAGVVIGRTSRPVFQEEFPPLRVGDNPQSRDAALWVRLLKVLAPNEVLREEAGCRLLPKGDFLTHVCAAIPGSLYFITDLGRLTSRLSEKLA
jgi:hypothetical protein